MISYLNTEIKELAIHFVGNKTNMEPLLLSNNLIKIKDGKVGDLLLDYFIKSFKIPEFYGFTFSNGEVSLNPLFRFCSRVFNKPSLLQEISVEVAKHLYEQSEHPQIKSGDLLVVYFEQLQIEGNRVQAVGFFKSENKQPIVKLEHQHNAYDLFFDEGIQVDKLDKGCLVFDMEREGGYRVCVVDKTSKSSEAKYWVDDFLNVVVKNSPYHQTNEFLTITKDYINNQFNKDFEVAKTDQIDLMERTMGYFKNNQEFDKEHFVDEVFHFPAVKASFEKFDNNYRVQNQLNIDDSFAISGDAVRRQNRVFKSVLKLDKNFHIYIHGNRDLIEKGTD
jgi:hypothetical protein